jgi:hypothetical protein
MDQLSWNIETQGTKSTAFMQSTADPREAAGQEAVLATVAEGAVVAEEAANSQVMSSMALTYPTPTAISPHKNGRP